MVVSSGIYLLISIFATNTIYGYIQRYVLTN